MLYDLSKEVKEYYASRSYALPAQMPGTITIDSLQGISIFLILAETTAGIRYSVMSNSIAQVSVIQSLSFNVDGSK